VDQVVGSLLFEWHNVLEVEDRHAGERVLHELEPDG
jgi:hypothetical protein